MKNFNLFTFVVNTNIINLHHSLILCFLLTMGFGFVCFLCVRIRFCILFLLLPIHWFRSHAFYLYSFSKYSKFFNKHLAIVGSSGSGKSHTTAKIIQNAITSKNSDFSSLNNSHIVIFDIHSEYATAFPNANIINIDNLILPYWLLNGDELEELFLDTGDNNNYNQSSLLRNLITLNKQKHNNENDYILQCNKYNNL